MADSKSYQYLDRGEAGALSQVANKIALGSLLESLLVTNLVEGVVVYADASDPIPGRVVSVYATAGSTKALAIIPSSQTLAAGQCSVTYGADGNATVATYSGDSVTEIDVETVGLAASYEALEADLIEVG